MSPSHSRTVENGVEIKAGALGFDINGLEIPFSSLLAPPHELIVTKSIAVAETLSKLERIMRGC